MEDEHRKIPVNDLMGVEFPDGISSMEQWGRALMPFGKLSKADVSYLEVMTLPEHSEYRKWCKSHLTDKTAGGVARDFVKYRQAFEKSAAKCSGYLFPGTSVERRLK